MGTTSNKLGIWLGKVFKKMRLKLGLSQAQVAERTPWGQGRVSEMENEGSCWTLDNTMTMANIIGLNIHQFTARAAKLKMEEQ